MLSRTDFARVTDAIKSASASMEARFLDMGNRLGTAVDTLGTLTQTFDRLVNELNGENLRDATRELSQIMLRVTGLTAVHDQERTVFGQLKESTDRIRRRVEQMGKAVYGIGVLAMNARIEAVAIGDAGLDFAVFTSEIGRTLKLAQTSLNHFTSELAVVGDHLRVAAARQRTLAQQQATAIRSIPVRLTTSVGAITERASHAVAAASAVIQKSRQVEQSISDAVLALQIGDITRQRLEHMEYALGITAAILADPGGQTQAADVGAYALDAPQRYAIVQYCCGLLSAQLLDAADEFETEVRRILSSLQDVAGEAKAILRLGNVAAGASGDRQGTFLSEIDGQVAEVGDLLDGLRLAREDSDHVAGSVSAVTARLVSHASTLSSLEEDIRIMGLNTSLKCGRLGAAGRPLMVIAQELRIYSNQIAAETNAITANLHKIVAAAGSLSGGDQGERAAEIAAVRSSMGNSVTRLGTAEGSLSDALSALALQTESVASLLYDIVARATVHEEIGRLLRQAAVDLPNATAHDDDEAVFATPQADAVLGLFLRSYTMERERAVHARHTNGRFNAMPCAASLPAVPAGFEDVFF